MGLLGASTAFRKFSRGFPAVRDNLTNHHRCLFSSSWMFILKAVSRGRLLITVQSGRAQALK